MAITGPLGIDRDSVPAMRSEARKLGVKGLMGLLAPDSFWGPAWQATIQGKVPVEGRSNPALVVLELAGQMNGTTWNNTVREAYPTILWKLTANDPRTKRPVANPVESGAMMQEGTDVYNTSAEFNIAKGLIFRLGIEAVRQF